MNISVALVISGLGVLVPVLMYGFVARMFVGKR